MIQPEQKKRPQPGRKLIIASPVFVLTILSGFVIITGVWLLGLGKGSTLYHNALLSTSTFAVGFFIFLCTGLYQGFKLKDDLGNITDKMRVGKLPDINLSELELPDFGGEGILGFIAGLIVVFILSILISFVLWLLGITVWAMFLLLIAGLYRIFFRGLRYIFWQGTPCKGRLQSSIIYGLGYTSLCTCWIYGIIFVLHYLTI